MLPVNFLVRQAGVGVLAPLAALEACPIPKAVAVVPLEDVTKAGGQVKLPEGAIRVAVSIKVHSPTRDERSPRVSTSGCYDSMTSAPSAAKVGSCFTQVW